MRIPSFYGFLFLIDLSSPNLYDKIRLEKGEEHDRCRRNSEQDEPQSED